MLIMRKEIPLCDFQIKTGIVTVMEGLPLDLFLEEKDDIDSRINNINNFYHWCSSRVLTLDRIHAKAILNSCALSQLQTDQDRAQVALSYKCLSLHDSYWVKMNEKDQWKDINLFDHSLNCAVDISLQGRFLTLQNSMLIASDCSTDGIAPKAWIREGEDIYLLKGNLPGSQSVIKEVEASEILKKLGFDPLTYEYYSYQNEQVSKCLCYTNKDISQISLEAFAYSHSFKDCATEKDIYDFDMMNLCDYLTGNSDRHWGNINLLYDDAHVISLSKLMDFNHCFESEENSMCLPMQYVYQTKKTQLETAVEIIKKYHMEIPQVDLKSYRYGDFVKQRLNTLLKTKTN